MKRPLGAIVIVFIMVLSQSLHAQTMHPSIDPIAYQKAIDDQLTIYGGSRYLYENADGYQRLIQYYALKRLGYDLLESDPDLSLAVDSIFTENKLDLNAKGATNTNDQDETTIAVNRLNPKIIVAGANEVPSMVSSGMPAYYTNDGGNKWTSARVARPLSPFTVTMGDPSLAAGDSGYIYYAYLVGKSDQSGLMNLVVASSRDGAKWVNGGYVVPADSVMGIEDKENIWVDNNPGSPHYGRIYLTWVHFNDGTLVGGGGGRIAWSDNRGKSWSIPKRLSEYITRFSEVRVGKNGEVFITYSVSDNPDEPPRHIFLVSTDGGKTFKTKSIAEFLLYPPRSIDNRPSLKYDNNNGDLGFRAYPYVAFDVDLKLNKIHLVYGSWFDNGSDAPAAILYYVNSTDAGSTWTTPVPLGVSNPLFNTLDHDRFSPWVTVDQNNGEAYCSYYSSERDPDNKLIGAFRTKLSSTLIDFPTPLEPSDFDPQLQTKAQGVPFIGDYQGSDSYDSVYAAVWTEGKGNTDGDVFVYIKAPNQTTGNAGEKILVHSTNIWLSDPSPNPVRGGKIQFSYYLPQEDAFDITFYNSNGVKIKTLTEGKSEAGTYTQSFGIQEIPSGTYFLRLSTSAGSIQKKLIISK